MKLRSWAMEAGLAIALFTLCVVGASSGAVAQANNAAPNKSGHGVTISPSLKEVVIGPGLLEAKTTIIVQNQTGSDLTANVRLVDFQALDEFGGVSLGQVGAPVSTYSLAHWMNLPDGDTVKLPNNTPVTIPVTISNDATLAPGGHYGAVIVSLVNPASGKTGEINLKQELASLLFVKKTGGETYGLELASMQASGLPSIPKDINLSFKSTGNVHVIPRGYVEVTDPKGTLIAKGIINPESTLVLPGKTRQFVTILQPVANATKTGRYKITAYYRYDGQNDFASKVVYFNRTYTLRTFILLVPPLLIVGLLGFLWKKKKLPKVKKFWRRKKL